MLLDLQGQERKVEDQPEEHCNSVCYEFDVKGTYSWVELPAYPEIGTKRSMGVVVHYLSQHLDAVLPFQVEQGADYKCEDIDDRP